MNKKNIVELEGVYYSYNGSWVLEDVNLEIEHGDFLAIFGPNGGGKTTLLKIIMGILRPKKGKVSYNFKKGKRSIGYLPQSHLKGNFPMKVIDLVLMGLVGPDKWGFWHSKKDINRAEKALDMVDMLRYRDFSINRLSGGELQRVYLARALISEPELLILDEPTSNIDPQARFCFYDFLGKLDSKLTLVMVSHDLSLSVAKINKIACVNKRLVVSDSMGFNKDMLSLIYGEHLNHTCPVTPYYERGKFPLLER